MTDDEIDEETETGDEAATKPPMIRLDQFLKLTGLVGTGGQAKVAIQAGEVIVNGEVETRRRRQLHPGDIVVWDDDEFEVENDEEVEGSGL